MKQIRIATRKSPLALWQTEHVATLLRAAHPGIEVSLVPMSTRGDDVLDRSLAAIGGKGLFLKELELAMLRGEADCAVHSLKDVPMELDAPFALSAILERADPADAFISNLHASLDALPQGARVGTSSLRRQAQLRARRPDLQLLDLRGNVNTRLAKLDAGDYDAIVLACAGLQRLGFHDRIGVRLAAPDWLPAPAQGAIALECRTEDRELHELLMALDHGPTRLCVEAERAMNLALHGSCHVPVAAQAELRGDSLVLDGLVGSAAEGRVVRARVEGSPGSHLDLGRTLAQDLLALGAGEFL
ncbi:hydroxymethylbilane synthase [Pseudoxanthomonas sacheonensis]|uniref:hydroxymethylbilane synthase n=1 Tax=Pseudoxanthomonas sacheonensis TaxID=443615 RepID=UPI0013D3D0C4|nr:hydroxymethylbilane synthase [Pseudoxanthomonas sacheonensis]KAF1706128.1 hydroxymethylbilane synthase [Pseudoxanthomonas sacheonensis]